MTLPSGAAAFEVRDERNQLILTFPSQADANYYVASGVISKQGDGTVGLNYGKNL